MALLDYLKLFLSKEFVSNAKEITGLIRQNKAWRKDIRKFTGQFYVRDRVESTVFIKETVEVLKSKGWNSQEQTDVVFILEELFDNSFKYGTPSKETSYVYADITITSTFIKFCISDFGHGFDLMEELKRQEAFDPTSNKHRGLSMISQITPEIFQENTPTQNVIIVIRRQGVKRLRVTKNGEIFIYEVGDFTYVSEDNVQEFVSLLKSLTVDDKVIIDFGSTNHMLSKYSIAVGQNLMDVKAKIGSGICVCGLSSAPFPIRQYFENRFPAFDSINEAIDYHRR